MLDSKICAKQFEPYGKDTGLLVECILELIRADFLKTKSFKK